MRELRDFYNPNMTASINGTEFEVECPTAREGLRLRAIFSDPVQANKVDDLEEINRLFRGKGFDEHGVPSGGLWEELFAGGVSWEECLHLGMTALIHYGIGEKPAVAYWESAGKGLTAEPMRARHQSEPKGPTRKTARQRTKKVTAKK